jgi:hypothetical protein
MTDAYEGSRNSTVRLLAGLGALCLLASPAIAQDKPNILIIWGDDIGQSNISAYTRGLMGYRTPNIDRLADEGVMFTDYYAELEEYVRVLQTSSFLVRQQARYADSQGAIASNLISLYKALGGGWELREGHEFVPEQTVAALRERGSWGSLIGEDAPEPLPADAPRWKRWFRKPLW